MLTLIILAFFIAYNVERYKEIKIEIAIQEAHLISLMHIQAILEIENFNKYLQAFIAKRKEIQDETPSINNRHF